MELEVKTFSRLSPIDYKTLELLIHIGEKQVATLNLDEGYWFLEYDRNSISMGASEQVAIKNTLIHLGYLATIPDYSTWGCN